jgi:intein/homing endonuclease
MSSELAITNYSEDELLHLLLSEVRDKAQNHLLPFILYTMPGYEVNWHHKAICTEIEDFINGPETLLVLQVGPRHGKTEIVSRRLPAWFFGKNPNKSVIAASYAADLSSRINRDVQRIMVTPEYARVFPHAKIPNKNARSDAEQSYLRNNEIFEIVNHKGSYRSAGVGGGITGMGADLLLIDDPIKNHQDAMSKTKRDHVWEWYTSTALTRLEKGGKVIIIMTRWHQDDLAGRAIENAQENNIPYKVVSFEAILETLNSSAHEKRQLGEALWPSKYPIKKLKEIRRTIGSHQFSALYQQSPTPRGGGLFLVNEFKVVDRPPQKITSTVRSWDKAGTDDSGAFTAGVKMGKMKDGSYIILDVVRGQWSAFKREQKIKQTAELDGRETKITLEQEPGPIYVNEKVQMADGSLKQLKDIARGDFVINQNKISTKVLEIHHQGKIPCVKIKTFSGREIIAGLDHPFLTPNGWIPAEKLSVKDCLALPSRIKTIPTSCVKKPEEFRLAGYFIGDGCVTFTRNESSINSNIVCSDPLQGEDIRYCAEKLGFKVYVGGSRGWTYYISGGVKDWLRSNGLAGKRTENKDIPDWVMNSSNENVANFLGAYFACDGGVQNTKHHPDINFYSVQKPMLQKVQSLLLRFGIYTTLRQRNYQKDFQAPRRLMYRICMRRSDDSMAKFAERIPVYGKKAEKLKVFKRTAFDLEFLPDEIIEIEGNFLEECMCITVENGSSFIANDFVVHNSGGKESAENSVKMLAGYVVKTEKVTGSKELRAEPYAAQVEAGNVYVLKAPWAKTFLDEHETFPASKYKDQVDAAASAFSALATGKLDYTLLTQM